MGQAGSRVVEKFPNGYCGEKTPCWCYHCLLLLLRVNVLPPPDPSHLQKPLLLLLSWHRSGGQIQASIRHQDLRGYAGNYKASAIQGRQPWCKHPIFAFKTNAAVQCLLQENAGFQEWNLKTHANGKKKKRKDWYMFFPFFQVICRCCYCCW